MTLEQTSSSLPRSQVFTITAFIQALIAVRVEECNDQPLDTSVEIHVLNLTNALENVGADSPAATQFAEKINTLVEARVAARQDPEQETNVADSIQTLTTALTDRNMDIRIVTDVNAFVTACIATYTSSPTSLDDERRALINRLMEVFTPPQEE